MVDFESGEPLPFATATANELKIHSIVNEKGYFLFPKVNAGMVSVTIELIGFEGLTVEVFILPDSSHELTFALHRMEVALPEAKIVGEKYVSSRLSPAGYKRFDLDALQYTPAGVMADPLRILYTLPGVASTGDINTKFFVRGGSNDQNLILLENIPIYNPFRSLGLFSTIDQDVVSALEIYRGGFGAKYGGRLSSVIHVHTREGNSKDFSATAEANLLAGKVVLEGPLPSGSFISSVRKSYNEGAIKPYTDGNDVPYNFYDVFVKINHANSEYLRFGKVTIIGYFSNDGVDAVGALRESYSFGNALLGLNWHQIWGDNLFSDVTISSSRFSGEVKASTGESLPKKNKVNDITGSWNFSYYLPSGNQFNFGLQTKSIYSNLQLMNRYKRFTVLDISGTDWSLYGEYLYDFDSDAKLTIGARLPILSITDGRTFPLEPRVALNIAVSERLTLKFSAGEYSQDMGTLTDESQLISVFDPWTILPRYLSKSYATAFSAGAFALVGTTVFELEGYYKQLSNVIEVNPDKFLPQDNDFVSASAYSYGAELYIEVPWETTISTISYSISQTTKSVGVESFTPRYDATHRLTIGSKIPIYYGMTLSAQWMFNSGMPFTPVAGYYEQLGIDFPDIDKVQEKFTLMQFAGMRNSRRLPTYHRFDVSLIKSFSIDFLSGVLGISAINTYNRNNIFYIESGTGRKVYMLPLMLTAFAKVTL